MHEALICKLGITYHQMVVCGPRVPLLLNVMFLLTNTFHMELTYELKIE